MSRDHESKRSDAATYPVLSDRPIEVHNPQRKVRIIAATYALAVLVTSAVGAYIAASIAVERSGDVRQQLQAELNERTRERDAETTRLRGELEQAERDLCAATAVISQTPPVVELRTRHRCGPADPGASSPPSASGGQGPPTSSRSGGAGGSSTTPQARPAPAPAPPGAGPPAAPAPPQPAPGIPPAPAPPNPPPRLCLPLVGCIL